MKRFRRDSVARRLLVRACASIAFAACVSMPIETRAAPVRVETAAGPVVGTQVGDVAIFRGLPYAAAPVGGLRWREPQAAARWTGDRSAVEAGAACPQQPGLSAENGGDPGRLDEDCLFVDVVTPAADRVGRPVLVWIHGGALVFGGGSVPIYDGAALARRGVVVVTVNYRLGALGFFAHPALERARPGGPINFGLLDQIAALRWVRQNIAAFGGDPSDVTIAGQSAGAESVLALMASPLATGLFAKAIAQSPYGVPSATRDAASRIGTAVATRAGVPADRQTLEALRAIPAGRLASIGGPGLSFAPTFAVGDAAVPRTLLWAFRQGREAKVPLVVGSNSDDASVVRAFGVDPAALVARLGRAKGLVGRLYPGVDDDAELGREVARDAVFTAFARRIAYLHAARAPTFRYYFTYVAAPGAASGAGHGAEVPFVFGTTAALPGAPAARDRAVERRVGDRWIAFAKTGRPDGDVAWPADDRGRGTVLEIGDVDTVRPAFMAARLDAMIGALNLAGAVSAVRPPPGTSKAVP